MTSNQSVIPSVGESEEVSNELEIIRLLVKNRLYYEKYFQVVSPYIKGEVDKMLYELVDRYYKDCPDHNYIGEEEFRFYLKTNYAHVRQYSHLELLVDVVYEMQLSSDSIKNYVHKLLEKDTHKQVEQLMLDAAITKSYNKLEDVKNVIGRYEEIVHREEKESPFFEMSIEDWAEEERNQKGFKWRLSCLNTDVGPLGESTLVHVFAYPNTGKTSFLASEVTYFAKQLNDGECIVWFNNEQAGRKVKERIFEAALNARKVDLISDLDRAVEQFRERGGDKIKLVDEAFISIEFIREVCRNHNVKCIVVDQGDKVTFAGSNLMEGPAKLKALYVRFRELAKEFNIPIITVGQANAEATTHKWLTMDMTENSKVGKAAEMDLEIGIGFSNKEGEERMRFLHICKNKLSGVHGKHVCIIDNERARYADMA